jgi:hypothetical protein
MAKKIEPSDVAKQYKWDIADITDFCADTLEDANDHNMAAALRAVNYGAYDVAIGFIELNKDQDAAGELTPELSERRKELSEKLEEYLDETDDEA